LELGGAQGLIFSISACPAQVKMRMAGSALVMGMGFGFFLGRKQHQAAMTHAALGDDVIGQMTDIRRPSTQHAPKPKCRR
jgi:hypothetical protein